MAQGDLVVDGKLLDATSQSLSSIAQAFEGLARRRDAAHDVWGHRDIAHAMDDVVDNWDERRKRLIQKIGEVREMTERCSSHFGEIECSLSSELQKSTGGSS